MVNRPGTSETQSPGQVVYSASSGVTPVHLAAVVVLSFCCAVATRPLVSAAVRSLQLMPAIPAFLSRSPWQLVTARTAALPSLTALLPIAARHAMTSGASDAFAEPAHVMTTPIDTIDPSDAARTIFTIDWASAAPERTSSVRVPE